MVVDYSVTVEFNEADSKGWLLPLGGSSEGSWSKSYVQGEGILSVLKEGYTGVSPWPCLECNK